MEEVLSRLDGGNRVSITSWLNTSSLPSSFSSANPSGSLFSFSSSTVLSEGTDLC